MWAQIMRWVERTAGQKKMPSKTQGNGRARCALVCVVGDGGVWVGWGGGVFLSREYAAHIVNCVMRS